MANKRIKLRGSKFGREELWVSSPTISDEINLRGKHDLIYHVAKVEATASAHSMVDVIPFFSVFSVFIILFESNASIKPKENILYIQ